MSIHFSRNCNHIGSGVMYHRGFKLLTFRVLCFEVSAYFNWAKDKAFMASMGLRG